MAFRLTRTYRSLLRLTEIASVLTRHGLGHLVDRLELRQHVPFLRGLVWRFSGREAPVPIEHLGARLVLVLEELGPTFIKLGQLLSGRPDLLPESWIAEFRRLQDRVPPFDPEVARRTIEEELGQPVDVAFREFDAVPLASGSIAQAHRATLRDGFEVIVKVRRPGIEHQLNVDLELLADLAQLAERYVEELRAVQPMMIVAELARGLRRELDFVTEATYTSKFHQLVAGDPRIRSPQVRWELVTAKVLVITKLPGKNIGDLARLDRLGLDRAKLAATLAESFLHQYFIAGLFHADPHPGNILVDDAGVIGLIDFGMVGQLTPRLRHQLSTALLACSRGDLELVVQIYTDIGAFHGTQDAEAAKGDLLEMFDKYFSTPLDKLDAGDAYVDLARVSRDHKMVLPRDFVLLGKSLVTISILCRTLDPGFSMARAVEPHAWKLIAEKFSPGRWLSLLSLVGWNATSLLERLPGDAKLLLGQLRRGELRQVRRLEGLAPLAASVEHAASRLALAVFLGSLVVGSSLLAREQGASYLALAGYVAGAVVGLWLVVDVLRAGGSRR